MLRDEDPAAMRKTRGWFTIDEAAKMLGMHRGGVNSAIERGAMVAKKMAPGLKVIHRDEIDDYLRYHRNGKISDHRRAYHAIRRERQGEKAGNE